eukprot:scaffold25076_cov122-Cylindrotheca_fusiformis.AAC.3
MSDDSFEFENTDQAFVKYTIGVSFVVVMVVVIAYIRKFKVNICYSLFHCFCPISADQQGERDRALAESLQRELDQEARDPRQLEKTIRERREWYESYIKPYTMTVESDKFFYAQETDEAGATILTENPVPLKNRKYSADSMDTYEEEDEEAVKVTSSELSESPIICAEEDENARLHLYLPVLGPDGHFRSVDAECTVCFSKYEEGDKVVWSDLDCKHAFHYDCMMPWLVKGKKRCPICRDWFVPSAKIEDQKKLLGNRLDAESDSIEEEEMPSDGEVAAVDESSTELSISMGDGNDQTRPATESDGGPESEDSENQELSA